MRLRWTQENARLFQLHAVGLHGRDYPTGAAGMRACFADLDALQLDTLAILGRSHDLVVQARVDGTHPDEALDLIHRERLGIEYWDKALCAVPVRHVPALRCVMRARGNRWEQARANRLKRDHPDALDAVYAAVARHGPLSSRELKEREVAQGAHRGWKSTTAANGALEVLWNEGHLAVSHRNGFRRYFDLSERVLPAEVLQAEPLTEDAFQRYWLKKRVANVGLLPESGDAESWALLRGARAAGLPDRLVEEDELARVEVSGVRGAFLAPADAARRLSEAEKRAPDGRARFIAPLDPLIWPRRGVARLWDFDYVWEVYKPARKRRWGYYVLPVLYKDRFAGRFDGKFERRTGTLRVLSYFEEPDGLPLTHAAVEAAFERLRAYLGAERIRFPARAQCSSKPRNTFK